jgi:GNAT superfamily N-acetyltransferase
LVAFSRVITDYVYKALILDVIGAPEFRNRNLGRRLMDAVCEYPPLTAVRHFELFCLPELIPFYQKWGFTDEVNGLRLLRKTNRL